MLLGVAIADGDWRRCSLNGELKGGVCACDPGWTGDKCASLKLEPPDPRFLGYQNSSMPSWGGDAIFANSSWHLFVTVKADVNSPYDNYDCNTAIARLEGPSRSGPFVFKETVLTQWHHEAHAVMSPDGDVLIFMLTYDGGAVRGHSQIIRSHSMRSHMHSCFLQKQVPNVNSTMCSPGPTTPCYPHGFDWSHQVVAVSSAPSVYGPWSHDKILFNPWPGPVKPRDGWNCQTNCPSVIFEPDGSVLMAIVGRQCLDRDPTSPRIGEKIGFLTAPHWAGPYTQVSTTPAFGWSVPADWNISSHWHTREMTNEDPYLYKNKRGYC
jgi:hypothetical protein